MTSVIPPELASGGGEDWWRDIDNSEADRVLSARYTERRFSPAETIDDAMDLFVAANHQAFVGLVERQDNLRGLAADLALRYRVSRAINN